MPLIIPPGFAHAVVIQTVAGDPEPMVCTFGVDVSAVAGDFELAANLVFAAWHAEILVSQSTELTLAGVDLYVGQDGEPPLVVESDLSADQGTQTGGFLPTNCAVLFKKRTGVSGRRGRGRFYVPMLAREALVDTHGVITQSDLDIFQNEADAFLDRLNNGATGPSDAVPMVVLHRSEGVGTEPPPTPVTLLEVDRVIATQRQRLRP